MATAKAKQRIDSKKRLAAISAALGIPVKRVWMMEMMFGVPVRRISHRHKPGPQTDYEMYIVLSARKDQDGVVRATDAPATASTEGKWRSVAALICAEAQAAEDEEFADLPF